jgi:hypothetical protein
MRSGSKRLMIGFGSFLIAATMVAPSFAAKKAVSDEELDMVTAAGQPVVITSGGTLDVSFNGTTTIVSDLQAGSQTTLRALILNNVVGENQVHNGININAAATSLSANGSQTNTITQSWGAIYDWSSISTAGTDVSNKFDCGMGVLICKGSVTASGTNGFARVLSKGADVIIHSDDDATVTYNPSTAIVSDIGDGAQANLVALVVNNVAGLNQVATGVNITNSNVALTTGIALGGVDGAGGPQLNNISQFRGTPGNFRVGNP